MPKPRYLWRSLTPEDRTKLLFDRIGKHHPYHSPPHWEHEAPRRYHITAACYEHAPFIGHSPERMDAFSAALLHTCQPCAENIYAWCVLPNHYHLLVKTSDVLALLAALGQHHGRTSHAWNGEENTRGRKVFFRAVERVMRSDRHYHATLNYIHHNPVHHGYTTRWQDWPWSSAAEYLKQVGRQEAERIWREYPLLDYGKGWDNPEM